ncbi:MAG: FkbM family methyltransferase [Brasilonema sp.]
MNTERADEILKDAYLYKELEQQKVLDNLLKLLHPEMIFVDIGAGQGNYIFQANKIIDRISLYAIEPDPLKFSILQENCNYWETLSNNNIYPLQIAISDQDENSDFYITKSPRIKRIFKPDLSQIEDEIREEVVIEKVTISCYKLDSLFREMKPDLIKIDIESYELKILQGSTNILEQGQAKFLIKIHNNSSSKGEDNKTKIFNFMSLFGYYPRDFYGITLFVNFEKCKRYNYLLHFLKRLYRQILPTAFRYWLRNLRRH